MFLSNQESKTQKAISIRQPWAWLIVNGFKDVENRTWKTKYRGKVLIHASLKFDMDGYKWVENKFTIKQPLPSQFERGGIVGEATIVDCIKEYDSEWFTGPNGFIISDAHPFRSLIKVHGRLGIFPVEIKSNEIE